MFRSLKYRNPVIRDHLARQYAMGLLTLRVKRRVEACMRYDPDFEKEVIAWQERLAPLNDIPAPVPAPSYLKTNVMAAVLPDTHLAEEEPNSLIKWWNSIRLWQGLGMASMALLLVLTFLPLSQTVETGGQLSYVAVMQADDRTSGEAPLVISAYAKTEDAPSRIELRWNDRIDTPTIPESTLWAIERDTGEVTKLVKLQAGQNEIPLNSGQWQAVKSSLELMVVKGTEFKGEVLLRGICLQLAEWDKA